jgi:hypothetical protein
MRRCEECGQTRPLTEFYRSNTYWYRRRCRQCRLASKRDASRALALYWTQPRNPAAA